MFTVVGRAFGTTDGPFRHLRPKFVIKAKKKLYADVLVYGDRRKLLDTAQDVLHSENPPDVDSVYPLAFWKTFAWRAIQSMHLFSPLELAILARAFDTQNVLNDPKLDVFGAILEQLRGGPRVPAFAGYVFADVLPRRRKSKAEAQSLLRLLGRHSVDSMWELTPANAVKLMEVMCAHGVTDTAMFSRVARKVGLQLRAMEMEDVSRAASVFAVAGHRDVQLFFGIAQCVAESSDRVVARQVVASFAKLEIDDVPSALTELAAEPS